MPRQLWVSESEVSTWKADSPKPFPDSIPDFRKITRQQKIDGLEQAGGQLAQVKKGNYLEGPELQAGFAEIMQRASLGKPVHAVFIKPQVASCLIQHWAQQDGAAVLADRGDLMLSLNELNELSKELESAASRAAKEGLLIVSPICTEGPPQHWTLLVVRHEPAAAEQHQVAEMALGEEADLAPEQHDDVAQWQKSKVEVEYYDSLSGAERSVVARCSAQIMLEIISKLLSQHEIGLLSTILPCKWGNQRAQEDGWSCGFWVLIFAEEEVRRARGENRQISKFSTSNIDRLSKWIACLQKAKADSVRAVLPASEPPVSEPAAAMIELLSDSLLLHPPPAIPPSDPPPAISPMASASELLAQGKGKGNGKGSKGKGSKGKGSNGKGEGKGGTIAAGEIYGCGTCRGQLDGCYKCNPDKIIAYWKAKEASAAAATGTRFVRSLVT